MPTELIVLIISLLAAVILSIIFYQVSIAFPSLEKKRRQARAKAHYKNYVAQRRREAWRNYQSHLRHQQRLARQQNVRRIGRQAHRLFNEAFPEMADPQQRGTIVRALVLHLLQSVLTGKGLSTQWHKQMQEFVQDVDGVFAMKQELKRWYKQRQAEISQNFESGDINEEELEEDLAELKNIYDDAMQKITFS